MSAGTCTDCSEGKFASGSGARTSCTNCSSCPAGKAQAAQCTVSADTQCSDLRCASCSPGTYLTGCDVNSIGECIFCATCSINQYLSGCGGDQAGACEDCPGNMVSEAGSQSRSNCHCDAGYHSEVGGRCQQCEAGKYSVAGPGPCASCEAGKFSDKAGAGWCDSCSEPCAIGQVETVACGSSGGVADRACTVCDEGTRPSNSRHTHANDCSRWVCKDRYTTLTTPNGAYRSRCVLPSPADTSSIFTVSIEVVLPLPELQVQQQEEQLVRAVSTLSNEDAGNIFLLSVVKYTAVRESSSSVLGMEEPGKALEIATKPQDEGREFSQSLKQSKRRGRSSRGRLQAHAPAQASAESSTKGREQGGHPGLRSTSCVTMGVRTQLPSRVEQDISLVGLNAELEAAGLPAASRLSAVTSSPGDLAASLFGAHGDAAASTGAAAQGAASATAGAPSASAGSPAQGAAGAGVDPLLVVVVAVGGLFALMCCLLATYFKCRKNGSGLQRAAQVRAYSAPSHAHSRAALHEISVHSMAPDQAGCQTGHRSKAALPSAGKTPERVAAARGGDR